MKLRMYSFLHIRYITFFVKYIAYKLWKIIIKTKKCRAQRMKVLADTHEHDDTTYEMMKKSHRVLPYDVNHWLRCIRRAAKGIFSRGYNNNSWEISHERGKIGIFSLLFVVGFGFSSLLADCVYENNNDDCAYVQVRRRWDTHKELWSSW